MDLKDFPALQGTPLTKEELDALPPYIPPKPEWVDLYFFDGKVPVKIGQFDWNYGWMHGGMFSSNGIDFGEYFFKDGQPGITLVSKYGPSGGIHDCSFDVEVIRLFKKDGTNIFVTNKPIDEVRRLNEVAKAERINAPFFREIE